MEVNFNNLRKQACYAYDKLCTKLNDARNQDANGDWVDGFGRVDKGTIMIEPDQLDDVMGDLRSLIGSIAMVYENEREDFKDVYSELYPQETEMRMAEFNPEAD